MLVVVDPSGLSVHNVFSLPCAYSPPELCCSSKQSEKPKELIIPLIVKNRWNKQGQKEGNGETKAQDNDSVDSQAVKELIEGQNLRNLSFIP